MTACVANAPGKCPVTTPAWLDGLLASAWLTPGADVVARLDAASA